MLKRLALSLLLIAGFAASATACDRQRILAIGGGCYQQQAFIQPIYQQQVLGFNGGGYCAQQFVQPFVGGYGVQQFAQPVYGFGGFSGFNQFRGPRVNFNFGRNNFRFRQPGLRIRF